ncbi:MAG: hypothetical protein WCY12_03445 [Candidatus Omnitrophota bacterium]
MKRANKTIIGAFVIVAVVLLVVGIVAFGSGSLFRQSDKYTLFFDRSAKGLSVGASVIFKGVRSVISPILTWSMTRRSMMS